MSSTVQSFTYLRPSALEGGPGGPELALQTSGGLAFSGLSAFPRFFTGFLTSPEAAARGLLAVADVAAARYRRPMLPASLDPVVTGDGSRLRFESFSGCGGVHARLDVLPDGLDGEMCGTGTTNVDVGPALREALARVGGGEPLHLAVGPDDVTVTTFDGPVVEKKVPLPERWLRGFAEVQVLSAGFDLRAEPAAAEAVRFLRALPRTAGRPLWAEPAGCGLRLTGRPVSGAVCLPGPDRLGALARLLRYAVGLRVYGPPVDPRDPRPAASAWEVTLPGMRLTLTLSPDADRGFSGEGAALDGLATPDAEADADLLSELLAEEPEIEPGGLGARSGLPAERVRAALTRLGTAGRVGYDVAEAAYYSRELPYDTGRVERMNPRLRNARALVASGAVTLTEDGALVPGRDTVHRLRAAGGGTCTCRWWARYRGGRGPCKHILAMRIARTDASGPTRPTIQTHQSYQSFQSQQTHQTKEATP